MNINALKSSLKADKDPTIRAIRSQLAALACEQYEIQALPPKGSDMKPDRMHTWDAEQLLAAAAYLKSRNARGYDIYVRPAARPDGLAAPLVFVDDISRETARKMEAEGFPFAALVESSPKNFQGWIRLAKHPISRQELTEAARLLARRYGGDPGSADWRHYGRLAGFTNRKPKHRNKRGMQPFAKLALAAAVLAVASSGSRLLAEARQNLKDRAAIRKAMNIPPPTASGGESGDPVAAFREAWNQAGQEDRSARDFSACMSLLNRGFTREQVEGALREGSPDLDERHPASKGYNYVKATVEKAAEIVHGSPLGPAP